MEKTQIFATIGFLFYQLTGFATFAYLTAVDSADFNAWNWIIIIPVNIFLGAIWPIYWGILHWVF